MIGLRRQSNKLLQSKPSTSQQIDRLKRSFVTHNHIELFKNMTSSFLYRINLFVLLQRGAGDEGGFDRGQNTGLVPEQKSKVEEK